jgi:hypothetical protein
MGWLRKSLKCVMIRAKQFYCMERFIGPVESREATVERVAEQLMQMGLPRFALLSNSTEITLSGKRKLLTVDVRLSLPSNYIFSIKIFDAGTGDLESTFLFSLIDEDGADVDIFHREVRPCMRRQGLCTFNLDLIKAFLGKMAKKKGLPIVIQFTVMDTKMDVVRAFEANGFTVENAGTADWGYSGERQMFELSYSVSPDAQEVAG